MNNINITLKYHIFLEYREQISVKGKCPVNLPGMVDWFIANAEAKPTGSGPYKKSTVYFLTSATANESLVNLQNRLRPYFNNHMHKERNAQAKNKWYSNIGVYGTGDFHLIIDCYAK